MKTRTIIYAVGLTLLAMSWAYSAGRVAGYAHAERDLRGFYAQQTR